MKLCFAIPFAALLGCSAPPSNGVFTEANAPDLAGYPYVAEYTVHRCGTLDCHGSPYRNLRVYGDEGLRYSRADRPCVPQQTTGAEVVQDYLSVVGLEPETMSAVIADHGASPERLTLIAKPLGIEEHKGGAIFKAGDVGYLCMTSWLQGATDTAACLAAMPTPICALPAQATVDGGAP